MTDAQTFHEAAAGLLGPRGFTCDPDLLDPWLTDWRGRYTGRALGLASPTSTEEVAQFVRLCAEHGVPIVAQGGNSGMSGGATPDDTGDGACRHGGILWARTLLQCRVATRGARG